MLRVTRPTPSCQPDLLETIFLILCYRPGRESIILLAPVGPMGSKSTQEMGHIAPRRLGGLGRVYPRSIQIRPTRW